MDGTPGCISHVQSVPWDPKHSHLLDKDTQLTRVARKFRPCGCASQVTAMSRVSSSKPKFVCLFKIYLLERKREEREHFPSAGSLPQ